MNFYHVVNYHITNRCNYNCIYCFGKFNGKMDPSINEAKSVINKIYAYFMRHGVAHGRINFAGGEPLLYKHLDEIIDYTASLGISVSIITNGSLLTSERIKRWRGKVMCIGISIDSQDPSRNRKIGRCCNENTLTAEHLSVVANEIHRQGIDLKINTVVSKFNRDEDITQLYEALGPKRIKLFKMHLVDGINDRAAPYAISSDEFEEFAARHGQFGSLTVKEDDKSMENSYLMINPDGELQINDNGEYSTYGSLKECALDELLSSAPIDPDKFMDRYKGVSV